LAALRQINEVKPNLKPGDIEELILNLETSERGLTKISSGKSFIEGLRNIAKAKSETARF
jgi:biotin synthase-like enzyme